MNKQKKILDLRLDGFHIAGYQTNDRRNPFRIYMIVPGHKRLIARYGDFFSVIYFLKDLFYDGMNKATMQEVLTWAKETGSI